VSATDTPPATLLGQLEYCGLERLALRNLLIFSDTLQVLDTFQELRHLDLSHSTLHTSAKAWLRTSNIPRVAQPAGALRSLKPHQDEAALATEVAQRIGSYSGGYEHGGGGESETFKLFTGEDGLLRFTFDWSGFWVSGHDADSDLYSLEGTVYPITGSHLLLVPEEQDGHLDLIEGCLPYARFTGDTTCTVTAPDSAPTRYDGPFGLELERSDGT